MIPKLNYNKGRNMLYASALAGVALTLPYAVYAQDDSDEDEVFELSPFEVDGSKDRGYYTNETLAGGRMNSQLSDLATTVQAVTEEFLNDVGATGLDEILIYTTGTDIVGSASDYSGISEGNGNTLSSASVRVAPESANNIRGLGSATRTVDYYESDIPFDSYISGRVDINRGANSFLFGLGSPAGIINSTTDKAVFKDSNEINFVVSTEDFEDNESFRTSVNLNRVLIEDRLAFRFATMVEDEEYIQRPAGKEEERFFGALTFKPFAEKNITLRASHEQGDIFSVPVDRLAPVEYLSGFLNSYLGTVWPVTAENPTGRMIVDSWDSIASGAPNMLGWDNEGNEISFVNNPGGAPVGTSWNLIYDDSTSIDGFPTRAMPMNISGRYYSGHPDLDPDGDGFPDRTTSTIAITAPYGFADLADGSQEYARFVDESLVDYSVFDFRRNLISGNLDYYENDFKKNNISLELLSKSGDFGIELGYDDQEYVRDNFIGAGRPSLTIDVNKTLPIGPNDLFGADNPNFGRVYFQTGTLSHRQETIERNTLRATAFAKYDFEDKFDSGPLSWLGRHTATVMFDENEMDRKQYNTVMGTYGSDVGFHTDSYGDEIGNARRARSVIYIGDVNMDAWTDPNFQISDFDVSGVPGSYNLVGMPEGYAIDVAYWNVGDPTTETDPDALQGGESILDEDGNVIGTVPHEYTAIGQMTVPFIPENGQLENREGTSRAINLQSFFLNDLLVANLGYREDSVTRLWNSSPPKDPDTAVAIFDPSVFNFDDTVPEDYAAENFAYGLVLNIPDQWTPEGVQLGLHYGKSDNFEPSPAGYDHDGNLLNSSSGSSVEYGITLGVGNKFNARLNWYEGKLKDAYYAPAVSGYRVSTSQTMLNWYRNSWDEMETYDADRDLMFDDALLDDGLDGSGNAQGIANNGKLDSAEANHGTENVIDLSQMYVIEQMGQEFITDWVLETTEPVLNTREDNNGANPTTSAGPELYSILTDTADLTAKGVELELTYNVNDNLRLMLNVTKQSAVRTNIARNAARYMEEYMALFEGREWAGYVHNFGSMSRAIYDDKWNSNAIWGRYMSNAYGGQNVFFNRALEGTEDPSVRKYRVNLVSNYSIKEGGLKGSSFGAAYRYQSKAAISYGSTVDEVSGVVFPDPAKPYYDDGHEYFDIWAGYGRKIFDDKVDWKIQLNIRNVFADDDPVVRQYQPDGTVATMMYPSPRQFSLRNTFKF